MSDDDADDDDDDGVLAHPVTIVAPAKTARTAAIVLDSFMAAPLLFMYVNNEHAYEWLTLRRHPHREQDRRSASCDVDCPQPNRRGAQPQWNAWMPN
ncbi:MAG TPA: hypothetical protein VH333_22010 [Pseudonocardiaceae bacterium]|nr:hypothetical protein [Pseudonocardiaceae bacterium]